MQPTSTRTGSLSVKDVSLTYGKGQKSVEALRSVSFDIRPNQFTVIVGPSGCGKSSLLYLAAGLNEVTGGENDDCFAISVT